MSLSVIAKVGQAVAPYLADFEQTVVVGSSAQTFTYSFSTSSGDPQAGIAFNVTAASTAGEICFDNVSLVRTN
jgi:hypothetical protein